MRTLVLTKANGRYTFQTTAQKKKKRKKEEKKKKEKC